MGRTAEVAEHYTGSAAVQVRTLGGGDAGASYSVRLDDGRDVFVKTNPPGLPGATEAEAASLRWLAEPGVIPVPAVHGNNDRDLVTEHLDAGSPTAAAAEELGRGLARLHAAGAPAHGAPPPGGPADAWIGLAPMRNEPCADWPSFYAEHRVRPYLRQAVDAGLIGDSEAQIFERACDGLPELEGSAEPPSRLHGDLWTGNVHWGASGAWLIDPAAHGGHRETDLAMLALFGCPHLERVLAAYEEVSPLADGWRQRVGLHQLFPLLVHTVLFGGGYARQAVAAARSAA
ncbi:MULTISPECIES: fructosamine kinase family protein [unclassified Saccharopolyspora]|uniref:fructosamine kinase family protein n=1 Tax=Saccharopolyspora TaxID=1835 RepID=UPI0019099435|nr:fructosamine kinase family protein [Saccharopolyspora sp. HNM0986]MBK0868411.1 fructosamine kinase family protein [Saccharopolyspora sp. HNM0986]